MSAMTIWIQAHNWLVLRGQQSSKGKGVISGAIKQRGKEVDKSGKTLT